MDGSIGQQTLDMGIEIQRPGEFQGQPPALSKNIRGDFHFLTMRLLTFCFAASVQSLQGPGQLGGKEYLRVLVTKEPLESKSRVELWDRRTKISANGSIRK
jgi:hypothetical protein